MTGERAVGDPEVIHLYDDADLAWRRSGPTGRALRALGVQVDAVRRMAGGAGYNWTDGRVVLKPVGNVPEHNWVCEIFASWTSEDVRVPEPVRPTGEPSGDWSVDGWGAHVWVPGRDLDLDTEVAAVKEAGDAFHHALRDVPRPDFLDQRVDPWAYGDRLAWEDATPPSDPATRELVDSLRGALSPVSGRCQPVHGDLLPNVLAADGLPLAVIDWPVYYRPPAFALAIAATDAVTFRGLPMSLLDDWATGDDWDQLLVRALLYRLGPTGFIASRNRLMGSLVTHVERAQPVVDAVLARLLT